MVKKEKGEKRNTIRKQILSTVILLMGIALVLLGGVCSWLNYSTTVDSLEQTMTEAAVLAGQSVSNELKAYQNVVAELGCMPQLSDPTVGNEVKEALIQEKVDNYGFLRGKFIGEDGFALDGTDYREREYFQRSIKGEVVITEPLKSKTSGNMTVIISAPVWQDGVQGGTVVGVVFLSPQEDFLNNTVTEIQVSENGSAYMIGATGNTIAHKDMALVTGQSNTMKDAESDKGLARLAEMERRMTEGKEGFGGYRYGGVSKYLAYAPVPGTDGWSIAINVPNSDFLGSTYLSIIVTIVLVLVALLIAAAVITRLAFRIGNPIAECTERLQKVAEGDLTSAIPVVKNRDETKLLAESTATIVHGMNRIIEDVKYLLGAMGEGRFDVRTKAEDSYIGDFAGILTATREIKARLNKTLAQIHDAAVQVNIGAGQMAEGAQSLAEGATDQAASVEELQATVEDVTNVTKAGTDNAIQTSENARLIGSRTRENTEKIAQVTAAMQRITDASVKIESIIRSIDDIASQTNLLSLNASIEAARAGEAGRGFAVVAGEIGQLAGESAQAAAETKKLIATALHEVENGNEIVEQTAEAMNGVILDIESVVGAIGTVAANSEKQLAAIEQINSGIEQISSVIQSNSATAQESSATSEELSAQATGLQELIALFKLEKQ